MNLPLNLSIRVGNCHSKSFSKCIHMVFQLETKRFKLHHLPKPIYVCKKYCLYHTNHLTGQTHSTDARTHFESFRGADKSIHFRESFCFKIGEPVYLNRMVVRQATFLWQAFYMSVSQTVKNRSVWTIAGVLHKSSESYYSIVLF